MKEYINYIKKEKTAKRWKIKIRKIKEKRKNYPKNRENKKKNIKI